MMERVMTMAVTVLIVGAGFGSVSRAGDVVSGETGGYTGEIGYYGQNTDAMVMEFEREISGSAPDPDELKRREYIPRYMEGSSGTVIGTITLVGDRVMRIAESGTRIEHEVIITEAQQEQLTTGFNISAELSNGRLVSFVEQGVPPDVEKIVYSAEELPTDNILEKQQKAF